MPLVSSVLAESVFPFFFFPGPFVLPIYPKMASQILYSAEVFAFFPIPICLHDT